MTPTMSPTMTEGFSGRGRLDIRAPFRFVAGAEVAG